MKKLILSLLLFLPCALFTQDTIQQVNLQKSVFELPRLPYAYEALNPYLDTWTMELHHDRHHKAYVDNLNKAIKGSNFENRTLPELFAEAHILPKAIRNNAGGHWNHTFYWEMMTGDKEKRKMPQELQTLLEKNFGSIAKFKELFKSETVSCFGSGFSWLVKMPDGTLKICSLPNQDNPLMDDAAVKGVPILTCDVWEHAYYIKYQNLRGDYVDAFLNVVNWDKVYQLFKQ